MTGQQERDLKEGLSALAASTRERRAGPAVEAAVLARMRAHAGAQPPVTADRPERWSGVGLAAAAALVLFSLSGVWLARSAGDLGPSVVHPAGFIPVPQAAVLPPIDSAAIVRVEVPVAALPKYGLAIPGFLVEPVVEIELLVAQDGLPRAVRMADVESLTRSTP